MLKQDILEWVAALTELKLYIDEELQQAEDSQNLEQIADVKFLRIASNGLSYAISEGFAALHKEEE